MIKKRYFWKELTDDGLLKEPKTSGPYYDEVNLNNFGLGYESEEEAVSDLEEKNEEDRWCPWRRDMILITEYYKEYN
jgi:hypothetical protein